MVRHLRPLGEARLGGTDVETPVDLHAVGAHDLSAHALTDAQRQLALARCARADHGQHGLTHRRPTLRSSSAYEVNETIGRPCGQCPAKSVPSRAASSACASAAEIASPARIEA